MKTGVKIVITDTVTPEIKRRLRLLQNQSPFWGKVGIKVHRSILLNFKGQGRPKKWKPSQRALSQSGTRKDGVFVGGDTLVDTGLLRASIGFKVEKAAAVIGIQDVGERLRSTRFGSVKRKGKAVVGSQVKYGPIHDQGLRGMPKRRFLMLQDKDQTEIMALLDRYLS